MCFERLYAVAAAPTHFQPYEAYFRLPTFGHSFMPSDRGRQTLSLRSLAFLKETAERESLLGGDMLDQIPSIAI